MSNDRIHQVVSRVFGIPLEKVTENSSPDNIEKWDSLSHINLIVSIEAEFAINLTPEEAMEMLSVKLIRLTLAEHGITDVKR